MFLTKIDINMSKFISLKCRLGLHKYEVYKEEELTDIKGAPIGKAFISRCSNCGKIRVDKIRTVEMY